MYHMEVDYGNVFEKGIILDLDEEYRGFVDVEKDKIADALDRINSRTGANSIVKAMLRKSYENYWFQTVAFNSLTTYITMNYEVRQIFERNLKNTGWTDIIESINASEELFYATLDMDSEEVAAAIEDCHMKNVSILRYNNENSLACVLTLAYYTAKSQYMIVREMPSGCKTSGGRLFCTDRSGTEKRFCGPCVHTKAACG